LRFLKVEVCEKLTEHLLTMAAGTFKDPVHSIFVYTHNPGCGTDTVAFCQTSDCSLDVFFIQMEAEEDCVAARFTKGVYNDKEIPLVPNYKAFSGLELFLPYDFSLALSFGI